LMPILAVKKREISASANRLDDSRTFQNMPEISLCPKPSGANWRMELAALADLDHLVGVSRSGRM
jgi:hypothetical protein